MIPRQQLVVMLFAVGMIGLGILALSYGLMAARLVARDSGGADDPTPVNGVLHFLGDHVGRLGGG